jgi:hypothetical protein
MALRPLPGRLFPYFGGSDFMQFGCSFRGLSQARSVGFGRRNSRGVPLCAAVATLLLLPTPSRAGIIAESTFDTSLDSWTSNTPAQISWSKTGGNPGGFILFEDVTNDWTVVDAPKTFLGNYTALNGVGTISFDHKIIAETGIQSLSPYEVDLSGPGGSATWLGTTPKGVTGWVTENVP